MTKKVIVCGAGGFIGSHLVKRLVKEGCWVRGVDLKYPQFSPTAAHDFIVGDLRDPDVCREVVDQHFDEVYQLAADMGGAGYIFTGNNDADIMSNSALINLNMLDACYRRNVRRIFYSSSACIYPDYNQSTPDSPNCEEKSAYPANPDSEYGWEKLFSERLYLSYYRNYGMEVRIARFHNIFGPEGTWRDGKEKAPAALCRKVAEANEKIQVWGDGLQTRSFLYIDECLDGILKLTRSNFTGPVNIGSEEMVSIAQLARMVIELSGKKLNVEFIPGPQGVRGRKSDNRLIESELGWKPSEPLRKGMERLYGWVSEQVKKASAPKP